MSGFGEKVSTDTMAVFLKRYGVPDSNIKSLINNGEINLGDAIVKGRNSKKKKKKKTSLSDDQCFNSIPEGYTEIEDEHETINHSTKSTEINDTCNQSCVVCDNNSLNRCAKCHFAFYCSKECQTKDWETHKLICSPSIFPPKVLMNSVYGLLLPEDNDKPRIVEIPLIYETDEENKCLYLTTNTKSFVNDTSSYCIKFNPLKQYRILKDCLVIEYRDNFLFDGSYPNKAVRRITKNKVKHDWRGPILFTKIKGRDVENHFRYIDFELKDYNEIIDYLIWYGSGLE